MASHITRRNLLRKSTQTAAALTVGSYWARTALADTRKIEANDRIVIGLIGAGGRGSEDCRHACRADNVVCAAAADVATFRLDQNVPSIAKVMQSEKHIDGVNIERYGDFRRLLDRKDIDAVIIGTPDHWHMPVFLAALDAGKHVYQEKPMSKSIEQGFKMLAASQKHPELTVQIGTQRRSDENNAQARELIEQGKIGEIKFARCYDCRNWVLGRDPFAPQPVDPKSINWDMFQEPCEHKVEYDGHRYFAWRWFWDYANGLVTDVGVHVLDIVHRLTGNDTPKSVVCNGGVYGLKYWETPDVVNAVWDYGTHSVVFTANFTNGFQGDGIALYGTKGTLEIKGNHIQIYEGDPGKVTTDLPCISKPWTHQHNWIACIRSGKQPNAPVELGVKSLIPLHLANMAYRKGTKMTWDADSRKAVASS